MWPIPVTLYTSFVKWGFDNENFWNINSVNVFMRSSYYNYLTIMVLIKWFGIGEKNNTNCT